MRLSTSVSVVAFAGLLASACTDPTEVSSPRPALSATRATSAHATTHPNREKYRDAGFHPATGQSGSAAIAVRALLGRTGTTDVEVTTGTFDNGPAPRALTSVQVKGYDPIGKHLFTSNNKNPPGGGTASFPYTGLARGSQVQVQAVVTGVSGARDDVVNVTDAVRLRPDLVALRVDGPAVSPVSAPVNFHAFIMERNGDVGARASCVLYVDGAAADRADGIWVDAGGVVACAMTHIFNATGTHVLEVRVENVRPGDYDDANNRVTASIRIVQPIEFGAYSLQANSIVNNSWTRNISTLTTLAGIEETWDQTTTTKGQFQFASIMGIIPNKLIFPVTLQGEMSTNGTIVNSLDLTQVTSEPAYWLPGASCATSNSYAGGADTYLCTYDSGYLAGYTTVQYDWWGADVRYHSDSYVTSWDPSCASLCERYIVNDWTQIGPMFTFGTEFRGRLSVQGSGDVGPATAMATVSLSPYSFDYDYSDPSCATTPVSTSCRESHLHGVGVSGYIDFGSWPPYTP